MRKKIDIPAIHDNDLKEVLENLKLFDKFEQGELLCKNCNKVISWDNLFALKVIEGSIAIFCEEPDCVENSND